MTIATEKRHQNTSLLCKRLDLHTFVSGISPPGGPGGPGGPYKEIIVI